MLSNCDWEALYSEYHPDVAYYEFLKIFYKVYDTAFPEIKKNVETKRLLSPLVTKSIQKFKKKKQKH